MKFDNITISKSIAIILMVVAHSRFSEYGSIFINMFHMPLFFFFSGYCFKEVYLTDFRKFAKKRIQGIYHPYLQWGLVFLFLHNIFYHLNIYNSEFGFSGKVSSLYSQKDFLKRGVDIVVSLSSAEQLIGGYWFLHSLFWGSFVFYGVIKVFDNRCLGGGILLAITLLLLITNLHVPIVGIGPRELLGSFFMVIGCSYKNSKIKFENKYYFILVAILLLIIGTKFWQCSMLSLTWQKLVPYSISAIAGTILVYSLSNVLMKVRMLSRILVYVGEHTLEILTWHFLSFKIVSLIIIHLMNLPIARLAEFPVIEDYANQGWWLAYSLFGICIPLLGVMCRKYIENKVVRMRIIN